MRGYFWGNMYLSSIQQGIQSAHCLGEMFIKYGSGMSEAAPDEKNDILIEWAAEHKTMILLNGGYSETIRNLLVFFDDYKNPYPFANFNEGDDALDGALTCVGIILPEKIYGAAALIRKDADVMLEIMNTGQLSVTAEETESGEPAVWEYNSWEAKLITEIGRYGLAS